MIPRAAAHVGARPTTATRSSGSGGAAPCGDDAAARVTSRGGGGDTGDTNGSRTRGASASALPDDLDQVWQPLLWDRPNRRWHPVDTVKLSGGEL